MKAAKTVWTSVTGGLTSAAPILLSACKSGACVGVCASPITSLFGISSASLVSSPVMGVIEPLLIAVSAVSFTVSYYSLYVLPKFGCGTAGSCDCGPTAKEIRRNKISKGIFWAGLFLSLGFLGYFEYSKYQSENNPGISAAAACSTEECAPGACETSDEDASTSTVCSTTECAPGTCETGEEKAAATTKCDSAKGCCSSESEE